MPGQRVPLGKKHPLTIVLDEIREIFLGLGFSVAEGPEVELDYYNFESAGHPQKPPRPGHPGHLLYLRQHRPAHPDLRHAGARDGSAAPAHRVIAPGPGLTAPTRWTPPTPRSSTRSRGWWSTAASPCPTSRACWSCSPRRSTARIPRCGSARTTSRLPSRRPRWTWPVSSARAPAAACARARGGSKSSAAAWCNPDVLSGCNVDPREYSGYAFGMGLERLVMRRYKIDDIRLFYENDVRFLHQF